MSAIGNALSIINLLPVRPLIVDPSASAFDAHPDHSVFSTQGLWREHICTTCNVIYDTCLPTCLSVCFCLVLYRHSSCSDGRIALYLHVHPSVISTHCVVLKSDRAFLAGAASWSCLQGSRISAVSSGSSSPSSSSAGFSSSPASAKVFATWLCMTV